MDQRTSRRGAALLAGVTGAGCLVATLWSVVVGGAPVVTWLPGLLASTVVGAVLVARRPDHPIAWILLGSAVMGAMAAIGSAADAVAGVPEPVRWLAWAGNAVVVTNSIGTPGLLLLLFPDGHLPSARWRPVLGAAVVGAVGCVVGTALLPGPLSLAGSLGNPLPALPSPEVATLVVEVSSSVLVVTTLLSVVSVVLRFRRSTPAARQQIKWLVLAAIVFAGTVSVTFVGDPVTNPLVGLTVATGWATLPLAVGAAVLRYRLYDIDRVISRTLGYGVVTLALAGAYAGLVVLLQGALSPAAGRSDLAVALSTLVVAAAFRPLRRRVQRGMDRRFNRSRYDAIRVLESFGGRLRDHVEREPLVGDLLSAVRSTVQPTRVDIWLVTDGGPGTASG